MSNKKRRKGLHYTKKKRIIIKAKYFTEEWKQIPLFIYYIRIKIVEENLAENNIEKKVEELLKETIQNLGYELYDVEYLKEGKEFHLCIYIDKPEGIDILDCEKVNDVINPILDDADYISEQYFLEVSSSGLERKLRKKEQFEKQIGNKIEVKLYQKIENKKDYVGILKDYTDDFLVIDVDGKDIKIELNQISTAKTIFEW